MNKKLMQVLWVWRKGTRSLEASNVSGNRKGQALFMLLTLLAFNGGLAVLWAKLGTHPFTAILELAVINIALCKVLPAAKCWVIGFRKPRDTEE